MNFKYGKEIAVGLLTVVSLFIVYQGVKFLKGNDFLQKDNTYFVEYDNVGGLTEGNAVLLNGLQIGQVLKIDFLPEKNYRLRVTLIVKNVVTLTDSSRAVLASPDLLGGKAVELIVGNGGKPLEDGAYLRADSELGMQEKLMRSASPVIEQVNHTMSILDTTLITLNKTLSVAGTSLKSFEKTSITLNELLKKNDPAISQMANNLATLSGQFKETEKKLSDLLTKMNRFGDTLNKAPIAKTLESTQKSMASLNATLEAINKGQGTMGKLAKNDSLYRNLNNSSQSLDALLKDFKENPKRYVHFSIFGAKADKPKTDKAKK